MTSRAEAFEQWIRTSFVEMNTELEELYFAQSDRGAVIGRGDGVKETLCEEGRVYVAQLLAEGNTGDGFDSAFGVLGSVGMYLAALRRHSRPICLRSKVVTSGRRWDRNGFLRTVLLMWCLRTAYALGASPQTLARLYGYK